MNKQINTNKKNWIDKINDAPIGKLDWILVIAMAVLLYFTFFYEDLIIIHDHSLTFWDSLFHGDIANFYANTMERRSHGYGAVYYWIPYLIQGIWSFPAYIGQKLWLWNPDSVKAFLWLKLGICLVLIATIQLIGKLLKEQGVPETKCKFAQFMFLSSLFVMLPVVAVAQIDIIALFLILLGIREYIRQDKLTWKFLLLFSLAAALKSFALFLFLPLLFLREKRILYVMWDLFVGLWGILICVIPYAWREDYKESTAVLNDVMMQRLFATEFPGGNTNIPIFFGLLIALCIWCYMQKNIEKEALFPYAAWIGLAVFTDFFCFVFAHPYWIVLLAPFIIFVLTIADDNRKVNMILETIFSCAIMVVYFRKFGVFMREENVALMVLPKLGINVNATGFTESSQIIEKLGLDPYIDVFFAVFVVCILAFVIINRPQRLKVQWQKRENTLTFDHGMIYVRILLIALYILGNAYIAFIN